MRFLNCLAVIERPALDLPPVYLPVSGLPQKSGWLSTPNQSKVQPIRGGTDGAQLSFKNLPCPNIFAGGMNMHGRYEYVSIQAMEKAMMTVVEICKIVAEK